MNRLADPRWLMRQANLLLAVIPAAIGWVWAFENFRLTYFAANGLMSGIVLTALAVAFGTVAGHSISADYLLQKMRIIPLVAALIPAAFVYGWLMLNHPGPYFAILGFFVAQLMVRIGQRLRHWVTDLRSDLA